jgi:hypothetical protein
VSSFDHNFRIFVRFIGDLIIRYPASQGANGLQFRDVVIGKASVTRIPD